MRDNDFRDWLSRRRYQGRELSTINQRLNWCRAVERALPQLGFNETDLDLLHAAGHWGDLLAKVAKLRADWRNNEAAARVIAPQSANPAGQMANARSSIGLYGRFADGDDPNYDNTEPALEDTLSDEDILSRFAKKSGFTNWWSGWSAEDREAFLRIARLTHEAGLDWYHVNMPREVRFGRKKPGAIDATEVFGTIAGKTPSAYVRKAADRDALEIADDWIGLGAFADLLTESSEVLARFNTGRRGLWPDEVNPDSVIGAELESPAATPPITPTNLILYGPPGTGKTYATAAEAVRLCGEPVPDDREALMALYRSLHQKGRIAFVTFHQNFSYEDFVEGLRPVTGTQEEGGASAGFSLQPQDGIFKLVADLAASNRGKAVAGEAPAIDRNRKIFKMSLGRSWASEDDAIYQDAIRGGYVVLGYGGEVDWSDLRYDDWEAIKQRWRQDHPDASGNDPNMSQMYAFRINMQMGSLVVISDGNRKFRAVGVVVGPYQFVPGPNGEYNHRRAVRWLWHSDESLPRELIYDKELSQVSVYQMNGRHVNWDGLEQIVAGGDAAATTGAPEAFVLIIDEINRANISKVFGELITLLEPDKRVGMPNALTVRLPYSKQEFGVPANLHVVGTMNTADRSIALLDTALRRRFRFRELAPDPALLPEAVDGVPLRRVLETINDRVEYLIDREHRIGHAFFLAGGGSDRAAIDATMRDKVIPLLQEYFFEDWSRVAAVLGERQGKGGGFLDCRTLRDPTGHDGEARESWSVRSVFAPDAYDRLIGKSAPPAEPPESLLDEAEA